MSAAQALSGLLGVFVLTLGTGYFGAQEFAYVSADRLALAREAERGDRGAARALKVLERLSFMLSGAQLGITMTGLVVGFRAPFPAPPQSRSRQSPRPWTRPAPRPVLPAGSACRTDASHRRCSMPSSSSWRTSEPSHGSATRASSPAKPARRAPRPNPVSPPPRSAP